MANLPITPRKLLQLWERKLPATGLLSSRSKRFENSEYSPNPIILAAEFQFLHSRTGPSAHARWREEAGHRDRHNRRVHEKPTLSLSASGRQFLFPK